jgi:alpha/beta superfamily hydrolase
VSCFAQILSSELAIVRLRKETAPFGLKVKDMTIEVTIPEWLKPGVYGAACGAVALAIAGFSWGGWVTGSTARSRAAEQSLSEVVSALALICVDQSKHDPQQAERLAVLKAADSWKRGDLIMANGWATVPGAAQPNSQVARVCADKIGA